MSPSSSSPFFPTLQPAGVILFVESQVAKAKKGDGIARLASVRVGPVIGRIADISR